LSERLSGARQAGAEFRSQYFRARLYLSPAARELLSRANDALADMRGFQLPNRMRSNSKSVPQALVKQYEAMDRSLEEIQMSIEAEFRNRLGSDR